MTHLTTAAARPPAVASDRGRIALAHEWLDSRAGSEKTFEALAQIFPSADLYALTDSLGSDFDSAGRPVTTTFLDRMGRSRRGRALQLPLMPLAWRTVTHERYDLVITSSHACVKGFRPGRTATHLSYCHTPARYVWDRHDRRHPLQVAADIGPRQALRRWDRRSTSWVDDFAANSTAVADRIREYYDRDARIIPPPVDTTFFTPGPKAANPAPYVLACSRFIPYKRLDLAILAADRLGIPIVLAGSGPAEGALRATAATVSVPVTFVSRPSDEALRDLYRGAAAFIFPALEDFGIVAIEAQACGTPVVGLAAGGSLDTVIDGSTGALAEQQDVESFADALLRALDIDDRTACVTHAQAFSRDCFDRRVAQWVDDVA